SGEGYAWHSAQLEALAEKHHFSLTTPWNQLPADAVDTILNSNKRDKIVVRYRSGNGRLKHYDVMYEGVIPNLKRRLDQTSSDYVREELGRYMSARPCPTCHGTRLNPEVL